MLRGIYEKHGKLVRLGQVMVTVGDSMKIPNIYGFGCNFNKMRKFWGQPIDIRDLLLYRPLTLGERTHSHSPTRPLSQKSSLYNIRQIQTINKINPHEIKPLMSIFLN